MEGNSRQNLGAPGFARVTLGNFECRYVDPSRIRLARPTAFGGGTIAWRIGDPYWGLRCHGGQAFAKLRIDDDADASRHDFACRCALGLDPDNLTCPSDVSGLAKAQSARQLLRCGIIR